MRRDEAARAGDEDPTGYCNTRHDELRVGGGVSNKANEGKSFEEGEVSRRVSCAAYTKKTWSRNRGREGEAYGSLSECVIHPISSSIKLLQAASSLLDAGWSSTSEGVSHFELGAACIRGEQQSGGDSLAVDHTMRQREYT